MLAEDQLIGLGEVLDRGDLGKDLPQALPPEPFEGLTLDPDQVGKGEHLGDTGERNTVTTRDDDVRQTRSLLRRATRQSTTRGRRHGNRVSYGFGQRTTNRKTRSEGQPPERGVYSREWYPLRQWKGTVERQFRDRIGHCGGTPSATHLGLGQNGPVKALVADDSEVIRRLLAARLAADGLQVVEADDGEKALEAIRAEPPDIVVVAGAMPKRSGAEVLRALREDPRTRSIPVVMVAEFGMGLRPRTYGLEPDDVIDVPFSPRDASERIHRLLARDSTRP